VDSNDKRAFASAAVAVAICGVALLASLSIRDWRVSALVRMSDKEPMAELARATDPGFAFVDVQAHYDGVYFYTIARDPFARGVPHTKIDRAAYRYGHPGYGWLAWLASAGRARALPRALVLIGLLSVAVAAVAASRLAVALGWSAWGGLAVALSPGVVFSITSDTSEPLAFAVAALALLAWVRGRRAWAAVAIVGCCFVKEPLVAVPAGLAIWELVSWARTGSGSIVRRIIPLAVGPALYAGWYFYLRNTFGVWPFRQERDDFLTWPLAGWWDSLRRAARLATGSFEPMQSGHAAVALLAVVGALLLIGMVRALRLTSPLDPIFLILAILVLSLTWYGVLYPKDLLREAAVPLALLPAVIAAARRPDPGPPPPG
jgi:hypothetical protein